MAKKKKSKKILLFIILLIIICLSGFLLYKFYSNKSTTQIKNIDSIGKYGYSLNNNASSYQKELFGDLKKILNSSEIDSKEYAKKITQLFLTDFFTLSNKLTSSDIGGVEYIYEDYKNDFISIAQNGVYKSVKNNLDGSRNQELPEVTLVEITDIKETKFNYKKDRLDSYNVYASISYKTDLKYPKNYNITLIKNNDKYEIAKAEIVK